MRRLLVSASLLIACLLWSVASAPRLAAQTAGGPPAITAAKPAAPSAPQASRGVFDGAWYWILERQRELTQAMTSAVRRLQGASFWSAAGQLALISFLYGVFHAAGPGHGKFVISSYALANAQTLRRGITVSFMAAFLQALSAIALVGILAIVVKATSLEIRRAEAWLETASWGLIALLGAWLLWGRLKPLFAAPRVATAPLAATGHGHAHEHGHAHGAEACGPDCGHDHGPRHAPGAHAHHPTTERAPAHPTHHHHAHGSGQGPTHGQHPPHGHHHHGPGETCETCGHAHAPSPTDLQGGWSWRQAWSIAFAVGVRPCTGAIAVLLFSLGIGLFAAGIVATFTMAVGTALTVSLLAVLAVTSRDLARRLSGPDGPWAGRIQAAAGIAGSFLVFALGASFFVASLTTTGPL